MRIPQAFLAVSAAVVFSLPAYGQTGGRGAMQGGGMMGASSMVRHRFAMHNGLPSAYAAMKNPLGVSADNVASGKSLYAQNCALCHGTKGAGDGEGGKALNPPPANLVGLGGMPIASDGFLYWTIAEGGVPVKSAMPPYKSVLKEEDLWKLVLYLRTL